MELIRYTEDDRDELELMLAEEANKKEINRRTNNGITVIAYWLMRENVTTIWVHDERVNQACEFEVPPDSVMEYFHHPFSNKHANIKPYQQSANHEG